MGSKPTICPWGGHHSSSQQALSSAWVTLLYQFQRELDDNRTCVHGRKKIYLLKRKCIYCLTSGRQNRWSLVPCWISGSLLTRSCKGPEIWLSHMNDIQQEILTVVMCSSVISSLTPHLISTTCEGGIGSLGGKKKKRIPGTQAHVSPCSTPWSWGRRIPSSSSSPSTYQWMWSLWRSAQPVKISV